MSWYGKYLLYGYILIRMHEQPKPEATLNSSDYFVDMQPDGSAQKSAEDLENKGDEALIFQEEFDEFQKEGHLDGCFISYESYAEPMKERAEAVKKTGEDSRATLDKENRVSGEQGTKLHDFLSLALVAGIITSLYWLFG